MRNPFFSRIGTVLCLSAWIFGAFLLGMGNAYFGISGDVHRSVGIEDSTHHAHQPFANHELHNVGDGNNAAHALFSTGSMGHGAHAGSNEPLPAHCLFCLDGLAATGDTYPLVRILFTEPPRLPPLTPYTRIFAQAYLPRPASRAPPAHSPAR